MRKYLPAKLPLVLVLSGASSLSAVVAHDPQELSPAQAKSIHTLMCTTESCDGADSTTHGCKEYATPLGACYNANDLFPGDESWSDLDIYDEMVMLNLKRTFYQSTDGSCAGRGEGDDGGAVPQPQPVDGDDSYVLPLDECVGPFGPPRPWGKFTMSMEEVDAHKEEKSEVVSVE